MKTRKDLIQEYKRTAREMGVYRIRNTINGKSYVAASRDIRARFNRHRMDLKTKTESVKSLLLEWLEFGEAAFEFEIVDTLEPLEQPDYDPGEDLKVLESMWLDKLHPFEPDGYNRAKKVRL